MRNDVRQLEVGPVIFAFADDRSLFIHENLEEVRREHEAIDVENGVVRFFDAAGNPLAPVFERSNRIRKFLWLVDVLEQGTFTLVPKEASTVEFREHVLPLAYGVQPNRWFKSLDDVRRHFGDRT